MSLLHVHEMATDSHLRARITAAAAQAGEVSPEDWAEANRYRVASSPGWESAWASARVDPAADPYPGRNEAVITDGAIVAAVAAVRTAPPF